MLRIALQAAGIEIAERGEESLDAQLLYLEARHLAVRLDKKHTTALELWAPGVECDDYLRAAGLIGR